MKRWESRLILLVFFGAPCRWSHSGTCYFSGDLSLSLLRLSILAVTTESINSRHTLNRFQKRVRSWSPVYSRFSSRDPGPHVKSSCMNLVGHFPVLLVAWICLSAQSQV